MTTDKDRIETVLAALIRLNIHRATNKPEFPMDVSVAISKKLRAAENLLEDAGAIILEHEKHSKISNDDPHAIRKLLIRAETATSAQRAKIQRQITEIDAKNRGR